MKQVKIVIGANYGDEGKGLMTRHFARYSNNPIVIMHNGTAQRGHTVDYNPSFRHVYHHFGSGTGDNVPTFFAQTFWVHPMTFIQEWKELAAVGITPVVYCDKQAGVITPFNMLVDHATEAYIAYEHEEPEFGSCGFGTWCATDKGKVFNISDFVNFNRYRDIMNYTWNECLNVLKYRGIDIDYLPDFKPYFTNNSERKENAILHFWDDLQFFYKHVQFIDWTNIYSTFSTLIFENGQGLGLDKMAGSIWTTTSYTGLHNPLNMLTNSHISTPEDFEAEVCYITRSYLTRHGQGPLEEQIKKEKINADMIDKTNGFNIFQGGLRYGYLNDTAQQLRITNDFDQVKADKRFKKTMAITHCNEFPDEIKNAEYVSYNPYSIIKR